MDLARTSLGSSKTGKPEKIMWHIIFKALGKLVNTVISKIQNLVQDNSEKPGGKHVVSLLLNTYHCFPGCLWLQVLQQLCLIPFWIRLLTRMNHNGVLSMWFQFDNFFSLFNIESQTTPGGNLYPNYLLHIPVLQGVCGSKAFNGCV